MPSRRLRPSGRLIQNEEVTPSTLSPRGFWLCLHPGVPQLSWCLYELSSTGMLPFPQMVPSWGWDCENVRDTQERKPTAPAHLSAEGPALFPRPAPLSAPPAELCTLRAESSPSSFSSIPLQGACLNQAQDGRFTCKTSFITHVKPVT